MRPLFSRLLGSLKLTTDFSKPIIKSSVFLDQPMIIKYGALKNNGSYPVTNLIWVGSGIFVPVTHYQNEILEFSNFYFGNLHQVDIDNINKYLPIKPCDKINIDSEHNFSFTPEDAHFKYFIRKFNISRINNTFDEKLEIHYLTSDDLKIYKSLLSSKITFCLK